LAKALSLASDVSDQIHKTPRVDARGFDFEATASLAESANRSGEDLVGISIQKGIERNFLS
jgi:hypothetical protein